MKKLFALLAVAFGVMSCQADVDDFGANVGGEQDVNILVSLPEATRASENGAFGNVDFDKYDIEYFFQVFDATNDDNCKAIQTKVCDDKEVSFPVRLIAGREYRFVVWAHLVDAEGHAHYTVGETLKDIKLNEEDCWVAMDDTRDAYTGVKRATFNGSSDIAIELTRPFAKLRVVTTDMEELLGVEPVSAVVNYIDTEFYTSFNALTETPADKTLTKGHDYEIKSYGETGAKKTLFADYFFAKDGDVVNFNIAVEMNDGKDAIEQSFTTAIPVKRNTLTTIEGNILTEGDDIKVIVDDKFEAENIIIEGEYTLTADMEVDRPIVVLAGTEAVIDLNGHNIINTTASETFGEGEGIIAYGNLTIKGEGTVKGNTMAVWARGNNNATITIEGGNFEGCAEGYAKGGRSVVYASSGNVINIYGGTFKALAADKSSYADKTNGVYAAINVADNNGMINVYGGSFYKQNPAAPGTEPKAWNNAHPNGFVVPGYTATQNGDWFEVALNTVDNAADFTAALANATAGDTILLGKNAVIEGKFSIANDNITIASFDATNPATIKGRINISGQYGNNVKFENVAFAVNSESAKVWTSGGSVVTSKPSIFMSESSNQNIAFDNCTFELSTSAHAFTSSAGGKISFNECKFNGNFNYAMYVRANIEVTNCTYTTTVTNVLVGACVNALANGKVVFTNNKLVSAGGNIGLSGAIVFASTNNDNGGIGWVGPVEFTVKDNTGFAYTYERFGPFSVDPSRHTFTEGSERFTF